jgi:hypothetical protein
MSFFSNGFGKFLCDYYGGKDNVCNSGVTDREIISNVPNDCTDLCTTCPEAELWKDLEALSTYPYSNKACSFCLFCVFQKIYSVFDFDPNPLICVFWNRQKSFYLIHPIGRRHRIEEVCDVIGLG